MSNFSWTSQNLIQNGHALAAYCINGSKRIDMCGDSLVFGVSSLTSALQEGVCLCVLLLKGRVGNSAIPSSGCGHLRGIAFA